MATTNYSGYSNAQLMTGGNNAAISRFGIPFPNDNVPKPCLSKTPEGYVASLYNLNKRFPVPVQAFLNGGKDLNNIVQSYSNGRKTYFMKLFDAVDQPFLDLPNNAAAPKPLLTWVHSPQQRLVTSALQDRFTIHITSQGLANGKPEDLIYNGTSSWPLTNAGLSLKVTPNEEGLEGRFAGVNVKTDSACKGGGHRRNNGVLTINKLPGPYQCVVDVMYGETVIKTILLDAPGAKAVYKIPDAFILVAYTQSGNNVKDIAGSVELTFGSVAVLSDSDNVVVMESFDGEGLMQEPTPQAIEQYIAAVQNDPSYDIIS